MDLIFSLIKLISSEKNGSSYQLSEDQVVSVLELRLQKLTAFGIDEIENEIKNSDDVNINQINNEIEVLKQVINENKSELEQIITKLSEIEKDP